LKDRWLALAGVMITAALSSYACGGSEPPPKVPLKQQRPQGLSKDDQSRCEFEGRGDREVRETAGPGSSVANIRRVYGFIGDVEHRQRVLLCREVDRNQDGVKDVVRTYDEKGEKHAEVADSNYDGKVDTWIAFTGGRIGRVDVDNNADAKADESRFYVGGRLTRIERDGNRDGKADSWEIYDEGHLQRVGVDVDHDGRVDRWDRDEVSLREQAEKEAKEEEERKKQEAAEQAQLLKDGGVTDARVSARNR
jgi:hypothetical protein